MSEENSSIPQRPTIKPLSEAERRAIAVTGRQLGRDPIRQLQRILKARLGDEMPDLPIWSMEDVNP
jgi:hypothetical protein